MNYECNDSQIPSLSHNPPFNLDVVDAEKICKFLTQQRRSQSRKSAQEQLLCLSIIVNDRIRSVAVVFKFSDCERKEGFVAAAAQKEGGCGLLGSASGTCGETFSNRFASELRELSSHHRN